mmetsp:Transcript_41671/g.130557  ORF Transcript_41671/g.130557 Transcript_41671/m.130557 type:complete len:229 (-) Transcript_41671:90-776(-)
MARIRFLGLVALLLLRLLEVAHEILHGLHEDVLGEVAVPVEVVADVEVPLDHALGIRVALLRVLEHDAELVGLVEAREVGLEQEAVVRARHLHLGLDEHDRVLVDVGHDELQDAGEDEVARAAHGEQRARVREGHGVELRHHGEGAGDDHDRELDVVREVVLLVVHLRERHHGRLVQHLLHLDHVPGVDVHHLHLLLRARRRGGGRHLDEFFLTSLSGVVLRRLWIRR